MATEALKVRIGADTAGFNRAMTNVGRKVDDLKKRVFSLKGMFAALGGYFAYRKLKDITLTAARYETLGVVVKVVGANAGYTAKQMAVFQKGLESTGISMIQARVNLTRMAQAQLDLTKSTELARIAQDAAVIGNINSSEAFERMIHGIVSGRILILRTIGIQVQFEEAYKRTAAALGKTTAELSINEKLQARMNEVLGYGSRIAGTYEAAMTTAGKQLNSFARYIENFKVKMGAAFGPALTTLLKEATIHMKDLTKWAERWAEANKKLIEIKIREWLRDLRRHLISIKDIYASLPEGIVGAAGIGLVGRILFGRIGWIFAVFPLLNNQIDQLRGKLREMGVEGGGFLGTLVGKEPPKIGKPEWGGKPERPEIDISEIGRPDLEALHEARMKGLTKEAEAYKEFLENQVKAYTSFQEEFKMLQATHGLEGIELLRAQSQLEIDATVEKYDILKLLFYDKEEMLVKIAKAKALEKAAIRKALAKEEEENSKKVYANFKASLEAMAELGGTIGKAAFVALKASTIAEVIMSTWKSAQLAMEWGLQYGGPAGPILGGVMAAIQVAGGLARVASIAKQKYTPPSYDQGGISTRPGTYYAGVPEAHIPLPSGGKVPVEFKSQEEPEGIELLQFNINVAAMDAQSFVEYTERNPQAIIGPIVEAIEANVGFRYKLKEAVQ